MKLSAVQVRDKANINKLLFQQAVAARANARPNVSQFPVGAAALVVNPNQEYRIAKGWNNEPENAHSTHAEQSLATSLDKGEEILRMIVLGRGDCVLAPCG